jgi:S1-C subfamily serine protease
MNKLLVKSGAAFVAAMMIATSAIAPTAAWARTSVSAAVAQSEETEKGVLIARVQRDGPAAKAGLRRGDILLSIDGIAVNSVAELTTAVSALKPNATAKLVVLRGDAEQTLTVTVGNRSGAGFLGLTPAGDGAFPQMPQRGLEFRLGQTVIESVVTGSPADKAGLKKGDVVLLVDGAVLSPTVALADVIGAKKPGDSVTIGVQTGNDATTKRDVKVTLGENPAKKGAAWLGVQYRPGFGMSERGGRAMPLPQMTMVAVVGSVAADSPAAKAGLRERDVISEIDGKKVTNPRMLIEAVQAKKIGDTVTLNVQRGSETKEIKVTLGVNPNDKGKPYLGIQLGSVIERIVPNGSEGSVLPFDLESLGFPDIEEYLKQLPRQQEVNPNDGVM